MTPELSSMLTQVAVAILGIVLTAIGIMGAFVLERLRRKLGVERDSVLAQRFTEGAEKALQLGLVKAGINPVTSTPEAAAQAMKSATSPAVQAGADYLQQAMSETLAKLGKDRASVEDAILARSPDVLGKTIFGQQPPKDSSPVVVQQ